MPLLPLIFGVVSALAILLLFLGLTAGRQTTTVQERLEGYGLRPRTLEEIELSQPFTDRIILPLIRGVAALLGRFTPQRNTEAMRHRLDLAGNPHNWTVSDFLGLRGLTAIVVATLTTLLGFVLRYDPAIILLLFGVGGILGFFLPLLWLGRTIRRRQKNIQKQLPDA